MRGNFYRFAKISDNTWQGYGPGRVVTFMGNDAEIMDKWNKYVTSKNTFLVNKIKKDNMKFYVKYVKDKNW